MMRRRALSITSAAVALVLACAAPAQSQLSDASRNWTEEKCFRYRTDWTEVLKRWGTEDLSQDFLDRHNAFIDGGCTAKADVCPRTAKELELANILTIRAMNARTASSFLPFACPK